MLESQRELITVVNKSKRTNHIFSGVLAGISMISNIVLCWPHLMSNAKQSIVFTITTMVYFSIVAILLMMSLINLMLTFRRDLPGELTSELRKIIVFLIYYSVAFAIRAIAIFLVYYYVWPQFNRFFEDDSYNPYVIALWSIQFLVYSTIPILYLAVIHFINWNSLKNTEENDLVKIINESNNGHVTHGRRTHRVSLVSFYSTAKSYSKPLTEQAGEEEVNLTESREFNLSTHPASQSGLNSPKSASTLKS